jgi:hypothetical protein
VIADAYCWQAHNLVISCVLQYFPKYPGTGLRTALAKKEKTMKTFLLVLLAVALLACPLARADGVDNFVWSSPAGQTFAWTWPASAPDSQFTFLDGGRIFTDGSLLYDAYLTVSPCSPFVIGGCVDGLMSQIMFSCVSDPQTCDNETTYWEDFAATFFTYSGGVITFIQGTYVPAPGVTDQWDATMTITPAPEASSLRLLLVGLAMAFLCAKKTGVRSRSGSRTPSALRLMTDCIGTANQGLWHGSVGNGRGVR